MIAAAGSTCLRADLAALIGVGAGEHRSFATEDRVALGSALVARIHVVAVAERDRGGAEEIRLLRHHRTRRIAEHAVDAHAELLEGRELLGALAIGALFRRLLLGDDHPRLHGLELLHEAVHLDHEIADDREVRERSDLDGVAVVRERRLAGELRGAVHVHPAAAADGHPARPAVRERRVDLVLDVVQRVEDLPLGTTGDLVALRLGRLVHVRVEASHDEGALPEFAAVRHQYFRSSGCNRVIVTAFFSSRGPAGVKNIIEWCRNSVSLRVG